jgi:predicted amidohydrolase YtcJ
VGAHVSVSFRLLIAAKLVALSFAGATVVAEPADLIVLDRNLFAARSASIGSVRVVLTLLGGREVYRDAGFDF